jgi:non-ribosomal peptide synthetase component F
MLLKRHRISHLSISPGHLSNLLEMEAFSECSDLKEVDCSGEVLPAAVRNRFLELIPAGLTSTYGCTETPGVTTYRYRLEDEQGQHILGLPSVNVKLLLLDKQLSPVEDGVPGDIFLGGPQLAKGYFKQPELTAYRFIT